MKKIDATVKKETLFIAAFTLIFSAVMELVFLLLDYWSYKVVLGNLLGFTAAVLNFFLMGYTVQKAVLLEEKEAKKKQKTIEIKEVRLSPNIDENDLNTKVNAARKFIEKGNKVKVTLRFRGREMAHVQSSKQILDVFSERMADVAVVDKAPKMEGRSMTMFLTEKR